MTETTKQELLKEYADDDYLTADELDELGLGPVSENGELCSTDEMREEGWVFRLRGDDSEVSGYLVEDVDSMPAGSILHYLNQTA